MSSCLDQVKCGLLNILQVLASLSPAQREFLVHFEKCELDPLTCNLPRVIESANQKQVEHLIRSSQSPSNQLEPTEDLFLNGLSQVQVITFGCIFRLLLLQETLHQWFSYEQLLVLLESCRMHSFPADLQLKVLHQLQQLLVHILPETLKSIHDRISQSSDKESAIQSAVFHLLESCQDQTLLYEPLSRLITADLESMIHIHEYFPKLQPIQLKQLVRLMQFDSQWNVLELRQLLSPDQKGWMGLQSLLDEQEQEDEMMTDEEDSFSESFSLSILEQPPERTVYKRCLKPNPTIFVKSNQKPVLHSGETLCIVPSLYRFDTNQPVLFLTGNSAAATSVGSSVCFKRLKVTKTSKQLDDTLFYLRFELRKTDGHKQSEALAYVHTKPFFVVSHSSLLQARKYYYYFTNYNNLLILKNIATPSTAKINEIVPATGTTKGGTRVVILGSNFEDTPTLIVKFDNIIVTPEFHGPGTLICVTPCHHPGQVEVKVGTDPKELSSSVGSFTFEDTVDDESGFPQSINTSNRTTWFDEAGIENLLGSLENGDLVDELLQSGFHPFSPLHNAAALGNQKLVDALLKTRRIPIDVLDKYGNTPLYWVLYYKQFHLLETFINNGANINVQNNNGVSILHLATEISPLLVAKLIFLGAWVNVQTSEGLTPIHTAAAAGNLDAIKVLIRCGAYINEEDISGDSALHIAVRENQIETVKLLIQEGIDVNIQNEDNETALHLAISLDCKEIVEVILKSGKCNLDLVDCTGATALLFAIERGFSSSAIEQLILSHKQNQVINKPDLRGMSPLSMATFTKQSEIINILENNGAELPKYHFSPISSHYTSSSPFMVSI